VKDVYREEIREEVIKVNDHQPKDMKFSSFFYPDQVTIVNNHIVALQDDETQYKIIALDEQNDWKTLKCFDKKPDRVLRTFNN